MKKFIILDEVASSAYNVQFTVLLLLLFYILHSTFYIPEAQASDDSSASSSLITAEPLQAPLITTQSLQAPLIKQILQESASKAAEIKKAVSQKLTNKEYSGIVDSKTDTKVTLSNSLSVLTDQYTDFSSQTRSSLISSGDFIVALGDINDHSELVAKKVIKLPPQKEASVSAYFGKVVEKGPGGITVTEKDGKKLNINITSNTDYQIGKETGDFSDISISKTIITVGSKDENGEITARFIYIIPSSQQPKSASSSATPKK